MNRLLWKAHLRPVVMPPDGLVVLSEGSHYLFEGASYVRAAPLLDGHLSDDEICAQLVNDGVSSLTAWLTLSNLRALGLVRETGDHDRLSCTTEQVAFWEALGEDAAAVTGRLERARVVLRDVDGTGVDMLRQALLAAGILLVDHPGPEDLVIVVTDDFLDPRLDSINRAALEDRSAWMLIRLAGTVPWIGPLIVPGKTGCWGCLAQRLRLNRQTESFIEERLGPSGKAPLPSVRLSLKLAAEWAVVDVLRWLATRRHDDLEGGLLTLDLKTNKRTRHSLVRRPQCLTCGEIGPRRVNRIHLATEPTVLLSSPKIEATGGRAESPEATFARLEHHVSPITGSVRALSESEHSGYTHVSASQTFPMYRYDFRVLRDNLLGRSGGKGFDPAQARTSALCEALERYSGIWRGEEEKVVGASRREFGEDAIDPRSLFGFSARQYAERDAWNATNDEPHAWVPLQFDDKLVIDWVPLWSLTQSCTRFAPAAYCFYGHPDLRHMFCPSDSNGCAAGVTFTEAAAHGLLELIERDAVAIWWYNCLRRPAVDLESFVLPGIGKLRQLYLSQGRDFWTLDLTTDLGVPVIAAVSACLDHAVEDIIYGFGSDFNPAAAVYKAVLEMNQSLFSVLKATPGGSTHYRTDRPAARRWYQSATRANQLYLVPDPDQRPRSLDHFNWVPHADWRDDVLKCVERLRQAGLETLVLDQTRPDIGLPVCRVVVPGLCHFWRRFGTRRLYEIPLKMAWQESSKAERDLNPWFIYF
jgi:bacteriocin biosynthesis cyclodehydratase domain-containing protein